MSFSHRTRLALASAVLASALPCASVLALDNAQDLRNFVHYTMIAKPDLAKAHLEQLLNSGISDAELADLVRETMSRDRLDDALMKGRRVAGLRDVVAELESRLDSGEKNLARNPDRIAESISMLKGTLRQRTMAEERLLEAGEFAVPQLLKQVTDGTEPEIRQRSLDILVKLSRFAVIPLSEALAKLDAQSQVKICDVLGRIRHSAAGPYLAELAASSDAPAASREAAARAAAQCGAGTGSLSGQYAALGRRFFDDGGSLIAYPNEATNNLWSFDAFAGLVPTPVPTPIYGEVMAMRLAQRALQIDSTNGAALATFIAANLKRENDLPDGETDPSPFGSSKYSPAFYAMGAGPAVLQDVLALAIDKADTPLIRDAIAALSKTAGAGNLWPLGASRRPLIEALQYPDRRVRYDAAIALGKALPSTGFAGDFGVVPILASAIRAADTTYALVLADNTEDQRLYANWLEAHGYTVVAHGGSLADVAAPVASAPGVDVIVVRHSAENAVATINALRALTKTSVAPVLMLTTSQDHDGLQMTYSDDQRILVRVASMDEIAFGNLLDEVLLRGSGGRMSEADAMVYAIESIVTLRNIAISNSQVFNISDAETSLIEALGARTGTLKHQVADVLAYIGSDSAQRALFDAALTASDRDQVELLNRVADSARRHGNRAEDRHLRRLVELVKSGGDVGEAAARVHGALNLSVENVVRVIAD